MDDVAIEGGQDEYRGPGDGARQLAIPPNDAPVEPETADLDLSETETADVLRRERWKLGRTSTILPLNDDELRRQVVVWLAVGLAGLALLTTVPSILAGDERLASARAYAMFKLALPAFTFALGYFFNKK